MRAIKTILLSLMLSLICKAVYSQSIASPQMAFDSLTVELGQLSRSDSRRKVVFCFRNTGDAPLIIESIESSCGCTKVTYPKHAIKSGKSGKIEVKYDGSGNLAGKFISKVRVFNNSPFKSIVLRIRGELIDD